MKVLITGSNGQLGRAFVAAAPRGAELAALTRADLDLADARAIAAAVERSRPDVIVNAAAYTAVDRAESESAAAYAINRDAARALAEAAAAAGTRLVHISTDFVFDGAAGTPYAPDADPRPLGVYGASKLAGENAAREALTDALIVRTAWVYGARGANFAGTMLRLMRERPEVRVVSDQVGTPTHAASLARALWALIAANAHGTHHFTDAGVASWYDFAVAIQEEALAIGVLGKAVPLVPIRTDEFPTPARRPAYSVLDKSSCWALLGRPAEHWRVELRRMMAQYREQIRG